MGRMVRFGCLGTVGLLLVCCVLGYFVGLPRARDAVKDGVAGFGATEIAGLFDVPGVAGPGTYTLTEADLNARIQAQNPDARNLEDWGISLTPDGYRIGFTANGDAVSYSGRLSAENGRLNVTDTDANADMFEWFFSAGAMGEAVEGAVNTWLTSNNLTLTDVQTGNGEVTLVTE